jgi:SynChlorMet cassette protein ScmD
MQLTDKLYANPLIVLREENDESALLFDPETGDASTLNAVSVFIWKHLNGNRSVQEIIHQLKDHCENAPESIEQDVVEFVNQLLEKGYAGYEVI